MTKPNIAVIIVGIDGWEKYTLPLIQSLIELRDYPLPTVVVIDNASKTPYRREDIKFPQVKDCFVRVERSEERLCYSAAINLGYKCANEWNNAPYNPHDWYIVLSNDVLCTGPFAHVLEGYSDDTVVGPLLKHTDGFPYLEGWAIATPRKVWDAIGQWDAENFHGSSWEDVWWSTEARLHGCTLVEDLPFVHLDQRQRYHIIPDFGGMDSHNRAYFLGKYGQWANK